MSTQRDSDPNICAISRTLAKNDNNGRIVYFLKQTLSAEFEPDRIKAWMIGSMVLTKRTPKDCDVLILYNMEDKIDWPEINLRWCVEFESRFGLPLHLTFLTFQEVPQFFGFLKNIFNRPHINLIR